MKVQKLNVPEGSAAIRDHRRRRIIGEVNGTTLELAKFKDRATAAPGV